MHPTCSDCIHAIEIDCETLGVCSKEIVALKPCECRCHPPIVPRNAGFFAEYPVVVGNSVGCGEMERRELEDDNERTVDDCLDDFGYHGHQ